MPRARVRRSVSLLLATWLTAFGVEAQPAPPGSSGADAGEVTVQAPARRAEALLDTPRAVSVDSTSAARRALARDVGERLDELPGVFVQRTTSASAAPILRGLGGQRALLLFDEMRLNDALTRVGGNALLTLIDPSTVERVEVVRGPASVMYGSDALGGVVLVTPIDATARTDGSFRWRGEVMARGASAERALVSSAMVEGEYGPVGLFAGASGGTTGRLIAGGDLGTQPYTGYDDRAVGVRATLRAGDAHRFGAAVHTGALLDAPRPDLSTAADVRTYRLQQRDLASLSWRYTAGPHTVSVRAGFITRTELRDRLRMNRVDTERDQVRTYLASARWELAVGDARVSAGAEASLDDVQSGTVTVRDGASTASRGRYVDGSTWLTGGAYAFWQQRLGPRWMLEAGARLALVRTTAPVDGITPATDAVLVAPVGSLGARVRVADGVVLMANALTGFRAPNLDDLQALGSGARSYDVPNASLGAERAWTGEVGARLLRGGWSGSLFVYGSRLTGLVVRVPSTFQGMTMVDGRRVFTRDNASDATMAGAEFDLAYRHPSGLYGAVSALYTWGENTLPDEGGNTVREPMAKIPPAVGRATVGWRHELAWAEVMLQGGLAQTRLAASDREDVRLCPSGPAACASVPGWSSLTVRGGWSPRPWITLGAAVENVWNGAFTPYGAGAPAAGINVVGMVRLRAR